MWRSLESSEPLSGDQSLVTSCVMLRDAQWILRGSTAAFSNILQSHIVGFCSSASGSDVFWAHRRFKPRLKPVGFFLGFSASLLPSCHLQQLWPSSSDCQQGVLADRSVADWIFSFSDNSRWDPVDQFQKCSH